MNKVWVIPSEITNALQGLGSAIHEVSGIPLKTDGPSRRVDMGSTERATVAGSGALSKAHQDVEEAIRAAEQTSAAPEAPSLEKEEPPVPPADPEDPPQQ